MLRAMTLFSRIVRDFLRDFFLGAPVRQVGYSVVMSAGREGWNPRVTCGLPLPGKARFRLPLIEAHDNRTAALILSDYAPAYHTSPQVRFSQSQPRGCAPALAPDH